ncbi:hypothetical protein CFB40_36250 [Burkholderia sp. AU31652]|uniref:Response regulatory domain-containing protein n=1 Tax=Burkholderia contaminans TaxID=488447 RepID=A0A6P2VKU9_9BURK|nr:MULTISPECIES: hypothetical protein [Burkholderia]MDN7491350.1 hypothetical protein [Burkholderia sp. AU45274]OXI78325.1 hypothetical protein CFB40_36250 [Burkholderia sp. AU31652]OXJ07014.1 hypothetical protein CFB45_32870 [Burkholderia sp. HI2500]VWC82789.1 hypothetical protein BCO71171_00591 [Burkholderia contaminans]
MEDGIDNRNGNAKAQFDEADRRLGVAEARIRSLFANPLANEAVRQSALEDYREARLLWLSADAVLRSTSVIDKPPRQVGRRIVILRGNAHVGESVALLLRLRGFSTTVVPAHRAEEAIAHGPASAVVVDVERDPDDACMLAVNTVNSHPRTRIVAMVPPTLERYAWRGFDAVLVKPVSIDVIAHAIMGDSGA